MAGAKLISFFERLEDLIPELSVELIPGIVTALVVYGDELDSRVETDPAKNWGLFGLPVMIDRAVIRLLPRLDPAVRESLLLDAIANSHGPSTPSHIVVHYVSDETYASPFKADFSDEVRLHLREAALERIRRAAAEGDLINCKNLGYVMYRWREWADPAEVQAWAAQFVVGDDEGFLRFLESLSRTHSTQTGDQPPTVERKLRPEWLADFAEPEPIVDRARTLANKSDVASRLVWTADEISAGRDPDEYPFSRFHSVNR